MVLIAGVAIFSRKPFNSFIFRTILSILAVGLYVVYLAPDVALAEAMLGALLTTFIYLLAFKIHSEVKVGILILPIFCEKYQSMYKGIVPEILELFAKQQNYKIKYIELKNMDEMLEYLNESRIDIGICYNGDFEILEVPVYDYNGDEKNYFEVLELMKSENNLSELKKLKHFNLSFCFSDKNSIIYEEFEQFYSKRTIDEIINKYLGRL